MWKKEQANKEKDVTMGCCSVKPGLFECFGEFSSTGKQSYEQDPGRGPGSVSDLLYGNVFFSVARFCAA